MDKMDDLLDGYFDPSIAPADLPRRLLAGLHVRPGPLGALADRLRIDATDRGVARVRLGRGGEASSARARELAARARRQLREYFAGERAFFTVPVDLSEVAPFQAEVLREAARVGFGERISYADLARRVDRPAAARAVGNALGANPVPLIIPCHRIVRGDGSWGHYLFGQRLKTELIRLEEVTPALEGCTTTRIVCRLGCQHVRSDRRVTFASVADARSVGYRACKVCRPQR